MLSLILFCVMAGLTLGAFAGYLLACVAIGKDMGEQFDRGYHQGLTDASRLTFGQERRRKFES